MVTAPEPIRRGTRLFAEVGMRFLALVTTLSLAGCGAGTKFDGKGGAKSSSPSPAPATEPPTESSEGYHSMAVADGGALPACTAQAEGWLAYLKAEGKFQVCSGGTWTDAPIGGAATAATGAPGAADHITGTIGCAATLAQSTAMAQGLQIPATGLDVVYQAAVLASGDVWATASIATPADQVGATAYYAATQVGSTDAAVIFIDDAAGPADYGDWNISLNRKTLVVSAVYSDSDLAAGTATFTFPTTACATHSY